MADDPVKIPVPGTETNLDGYDLGPSRGVAESTVTVDPDPANPIPQRVRAATPAASDAGAVVRPIYLQGDWAYASGTLQASGDSVTGPADKRCIGISVYAVDGDGSFTINGGPVIPVRGGVARDIDPAGNLTAPVIEWVSGLLDVFIQAIQ